MAPDHLKVSLDTESWSKKPVSKKLVDMKLKINL